MAKYRYEIVKSPYSGGLCRCEEIDYRGRYLNSAWWVEETERGRCCLPEGHYVPFRYGPHETRATARAWLARHKEELALAETSCW